MSSQDPSSESPRRASKTVILGALSASASALALTGCAQNPTTARTDCDNNRSTPQTSDDCNRRSGYRSGFGAFRGGGSGVSSGTARGGFGGNGSFFSGGG